MNHIALEVQGIEALSTKLRGEGIVFETEEITKMPDFFPNGVKNIFSQALPASASSFLTIPDS